MYRTQTVSDNSHREVTYAMRTGTISLWETGYNRATSLYIARQREKEPKNGGDILKKKKHTEIWSNDKSKALIYSVVRTAQYLSAISVMEGLAGSEYFTKRKDFNEIHFSDDFYD